MAKKKVNPSRQPISRATLEKAKSDATDKAIRAMLAVCLTTLRDVFGFGPVRLKRFKDHSEKLIEELNNGDITIDDLLDSLFEESGIQISFH